jgi:excisionase family DNA binding protein
LNYEQAADYVGVTVGALRALVSRRRVPHVRIGPRSVVFDRAELDAWIAARRVEVLP